MQIAIQNNKKETKTGWIILSVLIAIQLAILIITGFNKKGFYTDELWSYGLANSYYEPHIASNETANQDIYLPGSFFEDYLTTDETDRFSYDSVWYNQENDAHPPLFYVVIHTISSLFPETFSKWIGLIPNIIYGLLASLILYLIGRQLFKSSLMALIPVSAWIFSPMAISHVLLIRNYTLLGLFILLDVWISTGFLLNNDKWKAKSLAGLFFITLGGCLTHYYFYLFAFFFSAMICLFSLIRREYKEMFLYAGIRLGGVISSWIIFPGFWRTFLGASENFENLSARGQESFNNLLSTEYFVKHIKWFFSNLYSQFFYGLNGWLALFALVCFCIVTGRFLYQRLYQKRRISVNAFVVSLIVTCSVYLLVIIRSAPFIAERYYIVLIPLIWILMFYFVWKTFAGVKKAELVPMIIFILVPLLSNIQGIYNSKIMYLYQSREQFNKELQNYTGSSALFISNGRLFSIVDIADSLGNFSEVKLINPDTIPLDSRDIDDEGSQVIVFLDQNLDQQAILAQLLDLTRYTHYEHLGGFAVGTEDIEEISAYVLD